MLTLGKHTITDEDLAVIAHVVHNETPEQWAQRAYDNPRFGITTVRAKIGRHRSSYEAAKDSPEYKNAQQRMAEAASQHEVDKVAGRARKKRRQDEEDARIKKLVADEVARLVG